MELKLNGESVLVSETIFDGSCEQPLDVDFTLPDYLADIGKILKCRATPRVTTRIIKSDLLLIEGVTRIAVIYAGSADGSACCYEHELPYSCSMKLKDAPASAKASLTLRTEYVNCRAVSQRKIDVHGAFSIGARLICPKSCEVTADIEGAGVKTRKCERETGSLISSAQSSFTVSESLEIPSDKASIGTVLRNDAAVFLTECKPIAGKLMLKGEAVLTLVYSGDSGEGVERMEYTLGFSQFIDAPGVDEGSKLNLVLECTGVDIGLRTDSNGEYRRMNTDIHIFADGSCYRDAMVSAVTDAYSTEYELVTEKKQLSLEQLCGSMMYRFVQPVSVDVTEGGIKSVLDAWCELREAKGSVREGEFRFEAPGAVCVLYSDAEGKCRYVEKSVTLENSSVCEYRGEQLRAEAKAAVRSCGYTISGDGRIELRPELSVQAGIYELTALSSVSAASYDESKRKGSGDAVVLYFADKGEQLWDIAREHNSCVETIMSDNELKSETIEENMLLLIAI